MMLRNAMDVSFNSAKETYRTQNADLGRNWRLNALGGAKAFAQLAGDLPLNPTVHRSKNRTPKRQPKHCACYGHNQNPNQADWIHLLGHERITESMSAEGGMGQENDVAIRDHIPPMSPG